jgi:phosphoribosylglycinamide formyltransferase-1
MSALKRVTVLISGRGSNLKALIERQNSYQVTHVVSDKQNAGGLKFAHDAGIPVTVVERSSYLSLQDFKTGILSAVKESTPDIVALAGFMVVLPKEFIEAFNGQLLNIHPSLLPMFPGLDTHQRALHAKVNHHGCTVHYVDAGIDTGPLIAQIKVPVFASDTSDTLAARVIEQEHNLYPLIVQLVALGYITLRGRGVHFNSTAKVAATELGCSIFSNGGRDD